MPKTIYYRLYFVLIIISFFLSNPSHSAVIHANPNNYRDFIANLKPADTLMLQAGEYKHGLSLRKIHGLPNKYITISGPRVGAPAVFVANDCCNTVQFEDASYIRIQHLYLNGQATHGVDGVNAKGITHHIIIENLTISAYGDNQLTVGISTKGPAWNWVIRGNTIQHAGTGMYLGNSDGNEPFVNGLIEDNFVLNSIGYNLQIKHQNPRPELIGLPEGNNKTQIRHNVFSKASNYSSGDMARPNILIGHVPLQGNGKQDRYEIYANVFYQNPSESLFQGEGNIALYNNIMINDYGDAVNIRPHNDYPKSIRIFNNTIISKGHAVVVENGLQGFTQRVYGNLLFSNYEVEAPTIQNNLRYDYKSTNQYLMNPNNLLGATDVYPRKRLPLSDESHTMQFNQFTDSGMDFNGNRRNGRYRGAYVGNIRKNRKNPDELNSSIKQIDDAALSLSPVFPSLNLSLLPMSVESGALLTVMWSSSNTSSCEAKTSGVWKGAKRVSNIMGEIIGPLFAKQRITLQCQGAGGVIEKSVLVNVTPPDTTPPKIVKVDVSRSGEKIFLLFDEKIKIETARRTTNYRINHLVNIHDAQLDESSTVVTLTVSKLKDKQNYILKVANIVDQARARNRIATNTVIDFRHIASVSITGLTPKNYQIDDFRIGNKLYIDRDYVLTKIPTDLQSGLFVRSANDDKEKTEPQYLQFSSDQKIMLYVAYDDRIHPLPAWLDKKEWKKTAYKIESTDDAILQVYQKPMNAGKILLGGNRFGFSTYIVIVKRY